jgi:Tfp pilus assembly protein PilV
MYPIQPQRLLLLIRDRLPYSSINADQSQTGFTLSEVLVAILLTTTFVAVAMQGMVVAMLLKSKALHLAEANRWVQADLEQIRSQISSSQIPISPNRQRCHPTTIDAGFADLVRDTLVGSDITGTADHQLATLIQTSQTGKTFQVARTLNIPPTPANTTAKILGIQYTITPSNRSSLEQPILRLYTEVMPDAALECQ